MAYYVSVMKLLFFHAVLSMLVIGSCKADGEVQHAKNLQKLSSDFGVCPDGHKALKDVPILWGHFELFGKDPKDYTDKERELSARRDRGEIVFGGDILPSEPPKFRVICDQCGFTFHPSEFSADEARIYNKPRDWDAYWSRSAKDFKVFKMPFSKRLLSFPLMKSDPGSVEYYQKLSREGTKLKEERVSFQSQLSIEDILDSTREWLKSIGRNPAHLEVVEGAYPQNSYRYNREGIWVDLSEDDRIAQGIYVALYLTNKDATNSQMATPRKPSD